MRNISRLALGVLAAVLLVGFSGTAHALKMLEKDCFRFYFPEQETALARRLAQSCTGMADFLAERGLPVARPLHIILDDDLDQPVVRVYMYPHREIRLPLRAPGVLENGFLQADPWHYFLFMGMSMQGIYSERSGIPGAVHHLFGEIVSPNLILPDWTLDGIAHLLYEQYTRRPVPTPLHSRIYTTAAFPELDKVSNHPEVWPGRLTYRIYGRPFVRWLHDRYGWDSLLRFLQLHGRGIVPIEIEAKAAKAFGMRPNQLWEAFKNEHPMAADTPGGGRPVTGYWPEPFVYWNDTGVYPGLVGKGRRGRYGYRDTAGWLWLSQYEAGTSRIRRQRGDTVRTFDRDHVWDPGAGGVAVTRKGARPYLLLDLAVLQKKDSQADDDEILIAAPPGVMQLSGPVRDENGRVAVAGNKDGNWDIWLYDRGWTRLTHGPGIEMDPWFSNGKVVFASNADGSFQIYGPGMQPLTATKTAALLPRASTYLNLTATGWSARPLDPQIPAAVSRSDGPTPDAQPRKAAPPAAPQDRRGDEKTAAPETDPITDYTPTGSLLPNYLVPDLYIGNGKSQFGLSTYARDVTDTYSWDAGVRYDTGEQDYSWRLGGKADRFRLRAARYPFGYETERGLEIDETRHDLKLAWSPLEKDVVEIAANWRHYVDELENREDGNDTGQDYWATLSLRHQTAGNLNASLTADVFDNGSQSVYGETSYWFGQQITTVLRLGAGKTWGDLKPGHNTFRIGGNTGEGFFTQRPNRLFPLRGFDSNVLDAGMAGTGSLEIFWPLARLQAGYHTLPLFLHNISMGTFVDAGFADDSPDSDDLLASAGIELITGMELAWGFMANFRLGVAWPIRQPDDLDQQGPVLLLQIGKPL